MKWLRGVIAAAVLVMIAAPVVGQIPNPQSNPNSDNPNMGFRGTKPGWGARGPYDGVLFGDAAPLFTGGVGEYMNLDMYCVDYRNYVSTGNTWRARFTRLSDGDMSDTRMGMVYDANPGTLSNLDLYGNLYSVRERYIQAAWLSTQFTISNRYAVHSAIWNLFLPTSSGSYGNWIQNAEAWSGAPGFTVPADLNANYWYVATDTATHGLRDGGGSRQEYLVYVTPEPATLILMGTGLVAVAGLTVVMRQSVG